LLALKSQDYSILISVDTELLVMPYVTPTQIEGTFWVQHDTDTCCI